MTSSNARKITANSHRITMTTHAERKTNLAAQKLAGVFMLMVVVLGLIIGSDFAAVTVIAPLALAAIFSKEKILDFGIFEKGENKNIRTL